MFKYFECHFRTNTVYNTAISIKNVITRDEKLGIGGKIGKLLLHVILINRFKYYLTQCFSTGAISFPRWVVSSFRAVGGRRYWINKNTVSRKIDQNFH